MSGAGSNSRRRPRFELSAVAGLDKAPMGGAPASRRPAAHSLLLPALETSIELLAGNASQLVNRTLEALPEVERIVTFSLAVCASSVQGLAR